MKIYSIKNSLKQFLKNINYKRENQLIENFVTIHNDNTYGDSYRQMRMAKKTLANYAQSEGVKIDIYDARHELGEHDSPLVENRLSEKLSVYVTNMLNGKQINRIISARTDKVHPHIVDDYFVIGIPSEGLQQVRNTKHEYEDNFLRNLYRNIADMTKKVGNNK